MSSEKTRILERFSPRFDAYWKKNETRTRQAAAGFSRVLGGHELGALVARIARFYRADLPVGTEIVFDLMARPEHESATHAEQLGERALIEVLPNERPEHRLDVVLHELFHYFFASAKEEDLARLVKRFTDSKSPLAYPAYGILDEVLAATFGNAMVLRLLDRKKFDERMAKKQGFYDDEFIDPATKALLEPLDSALGTSRTLYDPEFFETYLAAVSRAFPSGMPPRAYCRPYVAAYEPELEDAYRKFDEIAHSGRVVSTSSMTKKEDEALFSDRPLWTHVYFVQSTHVASNHA